MTSSGELPTGTVTFMFTDIEGSTGMVQTLGDAGFADTLAVHDGIVRRSVEERGIVVRVIGDAFFAVFTDPAAAVAAAAGAQRQLASARWPGAATVRVRMGLHTGSGMLGGSDYVGIDVHRAARISDAAHGGQTLISATTAELVSKRLPGDVSLREVGQHRLKDLSQPEALIQVDVAGLPTEFPALRTLSPATGNLPSLATSFVGREDQLAEVRALLDGSRLVTLTGPGGTGKTRLSLEVAAAAQQAFLHGAYFVALQSITDPELVPLTILEALGLRTTAANVEPEDHLQRHLGGKQMLLVLDNLEQVLGAARHISDLLAGAPDVKIVVTSRAPLHIQGEHEYPVPPLALPEGDGTLDPAVVGRSEGVALFAERAATVRPDFAVTEANAPAVAQLVSRLDGLPLAIELAASRVKMLTPEAILTRLDNRLLANTTQDLPERQRTMANAIGWSYDLLEEPVRRLFERCSVFVGGATLTHIETVCRPLEDLGVDILDGLSALIDHSLLNMSSTDGEPRYHMLVVVREFAYAALVARGEDGDLRRRHAAAFAELAGNAAPHLLTGRQRELLDVLARDHDNLRAALDWAIERAETDLALGLVSDLWRFWQTRGHLLEAEARIDQALELPRGDSAARARALDAKGGVLYWRGDWEAARAPYEHALEIMQGNGDPAGVANALYNAAFPVGFSGEYDRAREYILESLRIAQEGGDRLQVGRSYWGLGNVAAYQGDFAATIEYAGRAQSEFQELDAPFDLGWSHFMIAQSHFFRGEISEAGVNIDRAMPLFVRARDLSAMVLILFLKTAILAAAGNELAAAEVFGAVQPLKARTGAAIADADLNQYEQLGALASDDRDEIKDAMARGSSMTVDEIIELAVST